MRLAGRIPDVVKAALNADSDPINRARVHILFYTLSISLFFMVVLAVVYTITGPPFQLFRILFMVAAFSWGLYKLLKSHTYKPAAHLVIIMINMLVWSNIFVIIQAINIVTIQYILLAITCSFYFLSGRAGIAYSILVLIPVILYFIVKGTDDIQVYISAQQASNPVFVTVMLFNFFIMIFINYHFLRAFHFALNMLKQSQKEERLANEKLKEAIVIAEASSKAKSDFLSTMSHELRTPLNSVIGMSYVLLADKPRPDQEENLKVLHFSAGSLLSLINDILDFNKLEYGKLELEHAAFSLDELIKSIHSGLKFQAEEKGLAFNLDIDHRLTGVSLVGDSTRLLQILFNLVGNAIKFTPSGTVDLKVGIKQDKKDSMAIQFRVIDTGIGISDENREIIFEPFSQASNNITRKFGGTGLGLAITRQLLQLHNTGIDIISEEGNGTTFEFTIVYSRASPGQVPVSSISSLETSGQADLSGLQILVAEDNAMNILLLKKLFSSWNVKADFAENGSEAQKMAEEKFYDVILMDIHMPVMDGYEASRRILKYYKGKKAPWIIALTASVANDIQSKITSAGLNDYISKPFNPTELRNRLSSLSGLTSDNSQL